MSYESNEVTGLEALLVECRRLQEREPRFRSALSVPAQLEWRVIAEIKAAREKAKP